MPRLFTQEQLNDIMEQGMVRQCACPALLTRLLSDTRYLLAYQAQCLGDADNDERVHEAIAQTTERVSRILEECLVDVLILEGWDPMTLKMPDHLVRLQLDDIACDLPARMAINASRG